MDFIGIPHETRMRKNAEQDEEDQARFHHSLLYWFSTINIAINHHCRKKVFYPVKTRRERVEAEDEVV